MDNLFGLYTTKFKLETLNMENIGFVETSKSEKESESYPKPCIHNNNTTFEKEHNRIVEKVQIRLIGICSIRTKNKDWYWEDKCRWMPYLKDSFDKNLSNFIKKMDKNMNPKYPFEKPLGLEIEEKAVKKMFKIIS